MIPKINFICLLLLYSSFIYSQGTGNTELPISDETQTCIDCHETVTPGIVADWRLSRHSKTTIRDAFSKDSHQRRISISNIPGEGYADYVIGCYECHNQNTADHSDSFDHFDFKINVVVSPNDCRTCHPVEVEEYQDSKKGYANYNLSKNSVYHALVNSVTGLTELDNSKLVTSPASDLAKGETCFACHGTEVKVEGTKIVTSDLGDIEVPNLLNWPNQGVGRINPDGSRGACTACHPRHSFSIEIARKPYTCGQCHLEPDVPAYNIFKESKHGNIFESIKDDWNWDEVPWQTGKDFTAPTCAVCHNSLLANPQGEIIAERSHDFGNRLWLRIFGLIYSHPQPKSGDTYKITNAENLPLPLTFDGRPAENFLQSRSEQEVKKNKMKNVCLSCHNTGWTESQFEKIEKTAVEADKMVLTSTLLMVKAWDKKIADSSNPFDEYPEKLWMRQWLFYANSVRYATAMMGPDYAAFKNGWWNLAENLTKIQDFIDSHSK